jgi:hypothetical protein
MRLIADLPWVIDISTHRPPCCCPRSGEYSAPCQRGQDLAALARAKQVLLRLGALHVEAAAHCGALLAGRGLKLCTTRRPPFSPGKISMLSSFFATLLSHYISNLEPY